MTNTATPSVPDLATGSDSGPISNPTSPEAIAAGSDNITNVATPTLTGTAVANATITLYDTDGTKLATATASSTGTFSIAPTKALDEGTHNLTVTATASGFSESAPSPALSVVIDTTAPLAPTAPALKPIDDTGVSNEDGITSATTLDFTGQSEPDATVTLHVDGKDTPAATAVAASDGSYTLTVSGLSAGSHNFTAKATDVAGNVSSASDTTTVFIQSKQAAAPAAPTLMPGSDTGQFLTDNLTDDATPTLTGSGTPGDTIKLFSSTTSPTDGSVSMTFLAQTKVGADGTYALQAPLTTAGAQNNAYSLVVEEVNAAGVASAPSAALNIKVDTRIGTAEISALLATIDVETVTFTVHFDQDTNIADASTLLNDLVLNTTGTAYGSIDQAFGSGRDYSVVVHGVGGNGELSLSFASGANIITAAGDPVSLTSSDYHAVSGVNLDKTDIVSSTAAGAATDGARPSATASGLLVAFDSDDATLSSNVATGPYDNVYVKNTQTGALTLVSLGFNGTAANGNSFDASISKDGKVISFQSYATNLIAGGTANGVLNTYVARLQVTNDPKLGVITMLVPGSIQLVSSGNGQQGSTGNAYLSADGSHIAFSSTAALLANVENSYGGQWPYQISNVYEEDLSTGALSLVTGGNGQNLIAVDAAPGVTDPYLGGPVVSYVAVDTPDAGNGGDFSSYVTSISGDGSKVGFVSTATNLGGPALQGTLPDIQPTGLTQFGYVYDAQSGQTTVINGANAYAGATAATDANISANHFEIDQVVLDQAGDTVAYVFKNGATFNTTVVDALNLSSGTTTTITQAPNFDNIYVDPSLSSGGGYVVTTSNPDGYLTSLPVADLTLYNPSTGAVTDVGNGLSPTLTGFGNAIVFEAPDPADASKSSVYMTDLGVDVGIGTIGASDHISLGTLNQYVQTGMPVGGTTDAPVGSKIAIRVYSPTAHVGGVSGFSTTITATVTSAGQWSALLDSSFVKAVLLNADGTPDNDTFLLSVQAGTTEGASPIVYRAFTVDAVTLDTPATPALTPAESASTSHGLFTNTDAPVITGKATANATVTLVDEGGLTPGQTVGTGRTDAQGNYAITTSALTQGAHKLVAVVKDDYGNTSAAASSASANILSFTVDSVAPDQPLTPVLAAASDSGESHTDDLTNVRTPTVVGKAEPGSTVTLYDSDGIAVLGTATADAQGNYSITAAALSDGGHALKVTATDAAGNVSPASQALTVIIDTAAPITPVIGTIDGVSNNSGSLGPRLDVTGTTEPGALVTLHVDGDSGSMGQAYADAFGDFDISSDTLTGGSHTLTVTASDAAGNTSLASLPASITIAATAPLPPGTPPGEQPTDGLASDNYIAGATVFQDVDGDGVLDHGEVTTTTGNTGGFQYYIGQGALVLSGGIDLGTGLSLPGELRAPNPNSYQAVISPLTTYLVSYAAAAGLDPDAQSTQSQAAGAIQMFSRNLSFGAGSDIANLDAVAASASDGGAAEAFNVILDDDAVLFANVIAGAGGNISAAFSAMFDAIGSAAYQAQLNGSPLQLNDQSTLTAIFTAAAAEAAPNITLSGSLIQGAAEIASNATTLAADEINGNNALGNIDRDGRYVQTAVANSLNQAGAGTASISALESTYNLSTMQQQSQRATVVLTAPLLSPDSDSGISDTDYDTARTSLTFTGTAPAGESIALVILNYAGPAIVAGTGVADANGNYAINVNILALANPYGTTIPSWLFDGFAIQAQIVSPTAVPAVGSSITALTETSTEVTFHPQPFYRSTLHIVGTNVAASSGDGPAQAGLLVSGDLVSDSGNLTNLVGAQVNVYADGSSVSIGSATLYDGEFHIETSALAVGAHSIKASVTDINGDTLWSAAYVATVTSPGDVSGTASVIGAIANGTVAYASEVQGYAGPNWTNISATTSSAGNWTLPNGSVDSYNGGAPLLSGGWDTITGLPLGGALAYTTVNPAGALETPEGATVIDPLTSIIARGSSVYAQQLADTLRSALNLSTSYDLLNQDPLIMAEQGDPSLLAASAKIYDTAVMLASLSPAGDNPPDAAYLGNAFGSLYSFLEFNHGNLDDATSLTSLTGAAYSSVAQIIAASNAQIDQELLTASNAQQATAEIIASEDYAVTTETEALLSVMPSMYSRNSPNTAAMAALVPQYTGAALESGLTSDLSQLALVTNFGTVDGGSTDQPIETFQISFSQSITGLTAGNFSIDPTSQVIGAKVLSIVAEAGSNDTVYDVNVATGAGSGMLTLDFSGGTFDNSLGKPLTEGRFEAPSTYAIDWGQVDDVAAAKLGDGGIDILALADAGNDRNDELTVFKNDGAGNLTVGSINYTGVNEAQRMVVGDFDGDGKVDAAIAGVGGFDSIENDLSVLRGNGDGTFKPAVVSAGSAVVDMVGGDFNGDGKTDLAQSLQGGTVQILLSNGDGTFSKGQSIAIGDGNLSDQVHLVSADLNGDGITDLVATDSLSNSATILLGNGNGTFTKAGTLATGQDPQGPAVGDINGNGIPDIVVANSSDDSLSIYIGQGGGTFAAPLVYSLASLPITQTAGAGGLWQFTPSNVTIGDVNNDGIADLVVTGQHGTIVLQGNGSGGFSQTYANDEGFLNSVESHAVLADINGDGRNDLIEPTYSEGETYADGPTDGVNIYLNAPQTTPSAVSSVTLTRSSLALPQFAYGTTPGAMSVNGNVYTYDLGTVTQNQAISALKFTLLNASYGGDSFDGDFASPTGSGFTVSGASLPGAVAGGDSYSGLTYTVDQNSLGQHTMTLVFSPRDVTAGATLNDVSQDDQTVQAAGGALADNAVAGILPNITLVVTDDVVAATPSSVPNTPTLALSTASDLGQSNSDGITSASSLTLNGTADDGDIVNVYDENTQNWVGNAVVSNGSYTLDVNSANLGDGQYRFAAVATDQSGTQSAQSNIVNVDLDQTAPFLTISTGSAVTSGGSPVQVTFTFDEPVYGFDISDVTVSNGTISALTTDPNAPDSYVATVTPNASVDGNVSISVADGTFQDLAGNNGIGATLSYPVNTTGNGSTVTLSVPTDTDPAGNVVVQDASAGTSTGLTIFATVSNGDPVTYALVSDGSGGGFAINTTTGVVTVADPSKLLYAGSPSHAYALVVKASADGLSSSQTFSIAISPPVLPTVTIGPVSSDDILNNAEAHAVGGVMLTGTSTGLAVGGQFTVTITDGTAALSYQATVGAGGAWTATMPSADAVSLQDGQATVTAQASDAEGNNSAVVTRNFIVALTAPSLSINAIAGDDILNNSEAHAAGGVALSGNSTGLSAGATFVVTVADAGISHDYTATVGANGAWAATIPMTDAIALHDGQAVVTGQATSAAGNISQVATRDFAVAETLPTVVIDPVAGDDVLDQAEQMAADGVEIDGSSSGLAAGAQIQVTVRENSTSYAYNGIVGTDGRWSVIMPESAAASLSTGTAIFSALGTDAYGNVSLLATRDVSVIGTGNATGDVHLVTFDGLHYAVQATGQFTLVRSTNNANSFEIQIQESAWSNMASVTTGVAARVGDNIVEFHLDRTITINGQIDSAINGSEPIQSFAGGELLHISAGGYLLKWSSGEWLLVENGGAYMDDYVSLSPADGANSIEGLLGRNAGQTSDFNLPDGTVLNPLSDQILLDGFFADAWRVDASDSLFANTDASQLTDNLFQANVASAGAVTATTPVATKVLNADGTYEVLTSGIGDTNYDATAAFYSASGQIETEVSTKNGIAVRVENWTPSDVSLNDMFLGSLSAGTGPFGRAATIDLAAFSPQATLGFSEDSSGTFGVLTISQGAEQLSLALLGQYSASQFSLAADGHGGAQLTYVPPEQRQLAVPHV